MLFLEASLLTYSIWRNLRLLQHCTDGSLFRFQLLHFTELGLEGFEFLIVVFR